MYLQHSLAAGTYAIFCERVCLPSPASNIKRRFVLHGLGGSGKTQAALQFAQDYRERYFCYVFIRNPSLTLSSFWSIFWIDCSSSQTVNESYLNIARTCRITEEVDFVKLWLTNSPDPWLLILDNADDPSLKILNCLPVGSRGTVLITTRNPGVTGLETVGTHELAGMDVKDAVTLLLRISKVDDESQSDVTEMASSVARTLGCLALAIVQAGAFILQKALHNRGIWRDVCSTASKLAKPYAQPVSHGLQVYRIYDLGIISRHYSGNEL
jgi:hypothetical protein